MQFGGLDLRNRVVAARQTAAGFDPYRFKWQPGMSERLLDTQDDPGRHVTRMTSPPTRILIDLPIFENAEYLSIRKGVLILNIALIVALSLLSLFTLKTFAARLAFGFCLVCFSTSRGWLMNLERGQQYLELATPIWLSLWLVFQARSTRFRSVLWATFCALRPTGVLVQLIAFFSKKNRREIKLTTVIASAWILLSLAAFGPKLWKSYFWQAQEWGSGRFSPREFDPKATYPKQPEFIDFPNNPEKQNRLYEGPIFGEPQLNLMRLPFMPADWVWAYWPIQSIAAVLLALLLFAAVRSTKIARNSEDLLFLRGYAFLVVAEYLLPIPRNLYVMTLILPLAFALFWQHEKLKHGKLTLALMLIGFFVAANFTFDWHTPSHHQGWADAAFFLAAVLAVLLPASDQCARSTNQVLINPS